MKLCFALLLAVSVAPFCPAQQAGSIELNLGVQAYKNARFQEARQHFERAIAADPGNVQAHLYLATAYAQQYIPGADVPANNAFAQKAIAQYQEVLRLDASSKNAAKGIGYLYLQMKEFDKAKESYRRAVTIDPSDPEPYYSIGVIDWTQTYQPRMETRAKLGLGPDRPLIRFPECFDVRSANQDLVADGIDSLSKALQLRPDYDDAMAYMNLMYRERADIECGDARANQADLRTADKWVDLTMAAKKAKAEQEKVQTQQACSPDQPSNCGGGNSTSPNPQ